MTPSPEEAAARLAYLEQQILLSTDTFSRISNGQAIVCRCSQCGKAYTDWTTSNFLTCHKCRLAPHRERVRRLVRVSNQLCLIVHGSTYGIHENILKELRAALAPFLEQETNDAD